MTTISNSTFNGNQATSSTSDGGALDNNGGTMIVSNSTIAGNSAGQNGGGINNDSGTVKLGSSIVANNTAVFFGPDLRGSITSLGNNVIGDTSDATISGKTSSDLTNGAASPLNLNARHDNGGPTLTMAIFAGSVAFRHGNCTTLSGVPAITSDQRGVARKFPCDTGAYEIARGAAQRGAQL